MEYMLGGFVLLLLGILIIIFGNTRFGSPDETGSGGFVMPMWLDNLIKWATGAVCIWFGGYLLFSHGHF